LEASTADEVVQNYANQTPRQTRLAVVAEIGELLTKNDDEIVKVTRSLGCYYDPSADGFSLREWLLRIRGRLG
jgi:hypothetical protein